MKISKRIIAYFCAAFLLFAAAGCTAGGRTPDAGGPALSANFPTPAVEEQAQDTAGQETLQSATQSPAQEVQTDNPATTDKPGQSQANGKPLEHSVQKEQKNAQSVTPQETNKPTAADKFAATDNVAVDDRTAVAVSSAEDKTVCTIAIYGDDYTILEPTIAEFKEGDSVLDILKKITRSSKIQMEYRGGEKSGAYVEGIDNLYEFDRGAESGWMYNVNGWYPNYGCGVYTIKKGDVIEWRYTKDLGKDLGVDMKNW